MNPSFIDSLVTDFLNWINPGDQTSNNDNPSSTPVQEHANKSPDSKTEMGLGKDGSDHTLVGDYETVDGDSSGRQDEGVNPSREDYQVYLKELEARQRKGWKGDGVEMDKGIM
ncbi:hypothetical protein HDU76_008576 [Blyttiomyces sp. JEL0837]|nr:hypothetical protein HDU76_008576 [Blyttiomyces sp. JEL0837]